MAKKERRLLLAELECLCDSESKTSTATTCLHHQNTQSHNQIDSEHATGSGYQPIVNDGFNTGTIESAPIIINLRLNDS